jgi:hypothetical protein
MENYSGIFLIFLCIVVIFSAGCTSQTVPSTSTPSPTPTTSIPTIVPTTILTTIPTLLPVSTTPNITPNFTSPVPTIQQKPEILDPNLLVFKSFSNQYYTMLYPEQWTFEENNYTLSTVFKNKNGQITYTLTPDPVVADVWVIKTDKATFLKDVSSDYPEYLPENIMRDFGHCFVGDTRSCTEYSVYLPDGRYSKKVFIATMNFIYEFRIQCPDDSCKNLGVYMTNSIRVKDRRSN